jgi:hypothetical protein
VREGVKGGTSGGPRWWEGGQMVGEGFGEGPIGQIGTRDMRGGRGSPASW